MVHLWWRQPVSGNNVDVSSLRPPKICSCSKQYWVDQLTMLCTSVVCILPCQWWQCWQQLSPVQVRISLKTKNYLFILASCSARRQTSCVGDGRRRNASVAAAEELDEDLKYLKGLYMTCHHSVIILTNGFVMSKDISLSVCPLRFSIVLSTFFYQTMASSL